MAVRVRQESPDTGVLQSLPQGTHGPLGRPVEGQARRQGHGSIITREPPTAERPAGRVAWRLMSWHSARCIPRAASRAVHPERAVGHDDWMGSDEQQQVLVFPGGRGGQA